MADIWDQVEAQTDAAGARYAGIAAPSVAPDAMGKAMKVADARGLPPAVVADNLGDYEQQDHLDALDAAAGQSKALARFLGDPSQSALAKDDVGVLGRIGALFTGGLMSQAKVLPGMAMPASLLDTAMADVRKQQAIEAGPSMTAAPQPSWFSEFMATASAGWQQGKQGNALAVDALDFGPAVMDPSTGRMTRDRSGETGARIADYGRRAEAAMRTSDATQAGLDEIAAADGSWIATGKAAMTNPRAVMMVVAQSLGATAPNLALSAAMPASRAMAAVVGGAGSFSAEQGFTVLDVMGESGVDTSNASDVTAFLRDKPKMEAARTKALQRGVVIGAFDALTAGFAGRLLSNTRRNVVSLTSRIAGEGAVQAGGGAAGEATAQLVTEGKITSQADIILEAAAEVPTFLAEGRGQLAKARAQAAANADRFDALGEQKSVSRLVDLAAESKTKERSATRFQSLIQDMTDDGADTIYLPADAAQKLYQSAADGSLDGLVDPAALREAVATGGEVGIPLAQYVAAVTPEQHKTIAEAIRLQPGTRHDVTEVSSEDIQAAIAEGLAEGRANDERDNGPAGQVFDDVFGQLLTRQDEKLARQSASVVQSVYRNLAERSGMDAWSLYQQFRINIPGAKNDTRGARRNIDVEVDPYLDALRTGKLPTDEDIYGKSFSSALRSAGGVIDSGGELARMDAGKQYPGLINANGMTLDDAVVWAYEEGFLTTPPTQFLDRYDDNAPDMNTLLDMLGDDLGGRPVFRPDAMNAERAAFREAALSLSDELDAAGIDITKVDNATARAALGPTYNQVPVDVARGLDMETQLPTDPLFAEAVSNTAGASITDDGLLVDLTRYQKPQQSGDTAIRTGVFYLPTGSKQEKHYRNGAHYGGSERIQGETLLRRPLLAKGGTGGKAPEAAYDQLKGKGAYQAMRTDILNSISLRYGQPRNEMVPQIEEVLDRYGADVGTGYEIMQNSQQGNTLAYALQENIVAHAVREAGYDSVLGYSKGKAGVFLSEVFDVRETINPTPYGDFELHGKFYQSPIPDDATAEQLRAKIAELELELRTDELTGLRNLKAFKEDENLGWAGVMAFDMDGLTALNKLGHDVGDRALQAIGNIMLDTGTDTARFYHTSGDEFFGRAETMEEAEALAQAIQDKLESVDLNIDVADSDGNVRSLTYKGIGISRGHGATKDEADQLAIRNKNEREAIGTRQPKGDNAPIRRLVDRSPGDRREGGSGEPRRQPEAPQDGLTALVESVESDYPGTKLDLGINGSDLTLSRIVTAERGKGVGTAIMERITDYADANGLRIVLTPSADFGGNVKRLGEFYKRFGFKDNKGKARDFTTRETMVRDAVLNQGGDTPRGSVTFGRDTRGRIFNIELLAGMDASTFMHEMGHVWLEVTTDLAARDGAPAGLKADMAALDTWLKHEAGTAYTVDQHEQFARGFEAYLREGKAPTAALRSAFARFKVWLTRIYQTAAKLNVDLTDDVRGVFDRIVASDAEIEEARGQQYHEALITDAIAVGMSPADFEAYNAAVSLAQEDAEASVAAEVLGAMQREQKAWWHQEKRKLRAEVTAELREQPVYRAQRLLRTGRMPDGTDAPDSLRVKLDKESLLDKFGQSFLRNLSGMYRVEGGITADEAAAMFGFGSGKEMVDALVNAPPLTEAAAAETDARMAVRHPDPMTDGTLPDRAMVAAHRDRQADVMLREIRALEAHTNGKARAQGPVIKGIAQAIIADKKLRNLQPATFKAAEAKAGREAFVAAGKQDWAEALAARRRQLLNFELFREAVSSRNESQAAAKFLTRFTKGKDRGRLGKMGGSYLDQVDALLDRFDFHKISDKAADRRASLAAWIAEQEARGVDLNLPAKLLDETFRTPYREMTMADLRALRDAVRVIDHLARMEGKLLLEGKLWDAAAIDADMATSLAENWKARPVTTGDRPTSDKVLKAFQQGRVIQATATDIARELDGFTDRGAVWRNTVGVIRNAINNQVNPRLQAAQTDLADIYLKHYTKAEIRDFGDVAPMPEVNGDLWSKRRLLALALNWGNDGNREAILTQGKARMTPEQAATLLGRLDARDWAFVGDVWQLIDSQWTDIAAAQKRRTGLVPERVVPTPFTVATRDGRTLAIPGGYYPLKYEADSVRTMKEEADDFYNSIRTGKTAKAATRNGHTIERVGSGGRTVLLDTSVVSQHLRDVIRDVHLGDAVNYVHGVLNGPNFKAEVDAAGVTEYQRALEVWLKDAASGEIGPRVWHERMMRSARTNFTASVLTFKTTSALLQLTGVVPSSVVVGKRNMLESIAQFTRRPVAMGRYIRESSPYMASRLQTTVEAVQQVADAEAGRFQSGKSAAMRWGFWMIGRVQSLVDSVTWLAAEQAGMRKFDGDIDAARSYADDVVTRAQSSAEFIDKSPLQRGTLGDNVRQSEWVKTTVVLQSYMIAKGNLAYEATRKTNFKNPKQAMKWAADMVMLYSIEGLIAATLTGKLPGDDDDDGILDDLGEWMLKDTLDQLFGSLPGGSVMVSQLRGYDSSGVLANAWGAYGDVLEQTRQDELDRAAVRSVVTAAGVTLGLPSSQINKTIDAIAARADGKDVSPLEYLTGPKKEKKP